MLYHTGCRTNYDRDMWPAAQAAVSLLQKAGVDPGIRGDSELCCGGRAYQMGYQADFLKTAQKNIELMGFNVAMMAANVSTSNEEAVNIFRRSPTPFRDRD